MLQHAEIYLLLPPLSTTKARLLPCSYITSEFAAKTQCCEHSDQALLSAFDLDLPHDKNIENMLVLSLSRYAVLVLPTPWSLSMLKRAAYSYCPTLSSSP